MDARQTGIDRSEIIEDLHHLRLMALLDEQVRDKGPRRSAADLDVDHRTLTVSLESARLSPRRWRSRTGSNGYGVSNGPACQSTFLQQKSTLCRWGRAGDYARGLECATIEWFSGFSRISSHRNLGAPPRARV